MTVLVMYTVIWGPTISAARRSLHVHGHAYGNLHSIGRSQRPPWKPAPPAHEYIPMAAPAQHTYRKLLRAVAKHLETGTSPGPYRRYVQHEFRAASSMSSSAAAAARLHMADEFATHLDRIQEHNKTLALYNIAIDRAGAQRDHVRSIAEKVGLYVPKYE